LKRSTALLVSFTVLLIGFGCTVSLSNPTATPQPTATPAPTSTTQPEIPPSDGQGAATMDEIIDPNLYYHLSNLALQSENKCLEGNRVAEDSDLGGAAFMDDCSGATGQLWKFTPSSIPGFYYLKTLFLEKENMCFESGKLSPDYMLGGASHMANCEDVSGQYWAVVPTDTPGYYYLQSLWLQPENKCLEGNVRSSDSFFGGSAYMNDCSGGANQLWGLTPVQ